MESSLRKPPWLKVKVGSGPNFARMRGIVSAGHLHTVCEEAMCPNMGRCWDSGRATLMILGEQCSRGCTFCNVQSGKPSGVADGDEPLRVADAVKAMGLKDVVITSVTRDDLPDGGAAVWAETVRRVHEAVPGIRVEVLVPDFGGRPEPLARVLGARPEILGHNLETVPRLYPTVRPQAAYDRSLRILAFAHEQGFISKTGIMVGLGESADEVEAAIRDVVATGTDILTIGQYLRPTERHLAVSRYVEPREFEQYREYARSAGCKVAISSPLVRSSYQSDEQDAYVASVLAAESSGA